MTAVSPSTPYIPLENAELLQWASWAEWIQEKEVRSFISPQNPRKPLTIEAPPPPPLSGYFPSSPGQAASLPFGIRENRERQAQLIILSFQWWGTENFASLNKETIFYVFTYSHWKFMSCHCNSEQLWQLPSPPLGQFHHQPAGLSQASSFPSSVYGSVDNSTISQQG